MAAKKTITKSSANIECAICGRLQTGQLVRIQMRSFMSLLNEHRFSAEQTKNYYRIIVQTHQLVKCVEWFMHVTLCATAYGLLSSLSGIYNFLR